MCVPEVVISGVEPGGGQVSVDGGESPASPGYHCQCASPPPPSTIHLSFCSEIARVVNDLCSFTKRSNELVVWINKENR